MGNNEVATGTDGGSRRTRRQQLERHTPLARKCEVGLFFFFFHALGRASLGVGSRLAYLNLPPKYYWVPIAGALLYGITTPIGIAFGHGVRTTYNLNPDSTTPSIVSGILDSLNAGVLVYTGLVELLVHEFLFNKEMTSSS